MTRGQLGYGGIAMAAGGLALALLGAGTPVLTADARGAA